MAGRAHTPWSFWEKDLWFSQVDLAVIGAGIVGLSAAIRYKELHPKAHVLVLERGSLPLGGSTRNAGFACYGSPTEILDDLKTESEDVVFSRVEARYRGLLHLREWLGDKAMMYEQHGGTEVFRKADREAMEGALDRLGYINQSLKGVFPDVPFVQDDSKMKSLTGFIGAIHTPYEGQVHSAMLVNALLHKARSLGITIVNGIEVIEFRELNLRIDIYTQLGKFYASQLMVCVNGFAQKLMPHLPIEPARGQIIITEPVFKNPLKGNFHVDRGYYYFRNVGTRILLGGGRQRKPGIEKTFAQNTTNDLMWHLRQFMKYHINAKAPIAMEWAGTMGLGPGNEREPIVEMMSPKLGVAARLGGMGVALGATLGRTLAEKMGGKG